MKSFEFYNPTRIIFGEDREHEIGKAISELGFNNILLCFGSDRIKSDGLFQNIAHSLIAKNIQWMEFGGIVSNPLLSKVNEGIELARSKSVDAVLSIGGGSVLDSAKAIAAGVHYNGDIWDLFSGKDIIKSALPIFDIMTLSATGSEMNGTAVITNEATQEKFFVASEHLSPKISIINPLLMQSVPQDYLVYSATDIIAHTIEGYFTASNQPYLPSVLVESIIKTVIRSTDILLKNPKDYNARAEFSWASILALNGLTTAGIANFSHPNHMIEHSLSALFNVPHGAGLSVVIPAWMKWYFPRNQVQFERFAKVIFNEDSAEKGIQAFEDWLNTIGTPTRLSQLSITDKDLPAITNNALNSTQRFGLDDLYTQEVIDTILRNAL